MDFLKVNMYRRSKPEPRQVDTRYFVDHVLNPHFHAGDLTPPMHVIGVASIGAYHFPADDLINDLIAWLRAREQLSDEDAHVSFVNHYTLDLYMPQPVQFVVVECRNRSGRRLLRSGETFPLVCELRHKQEPLCETGKRQYLIVFVIYTKPEDLDVKMRSIMRAVITVPDVKSEPITFQTSAGDHGELDMASLGDAGKAKPLWVVE